MAMQEARQQIRPEYERRPAAGRRSVRRHRDGDRASQDGGLLAMDEERLANALGWFSIGLGLAEVVAPGSVARLVGVRDDERNRWALRAMGVREVVSGVGILAQPRPAGWVWAAVGGVTALDVMCGERLSANAGSSAGRSRAWMARAPHERAVHVRKSVTIDRPAEDLYAFWRDFHRLP